MPGQFGSGSTLPMSYRLESLKGIEPSPLPELNFTTTKGIKMLRLIALSLFAILTGCAGIGGTLTGTTPEAQIVKGADAHKAASTLATVALRNNAITVSQAKGFSTLLHAASATLDQVNATLLACRKNTGSTQKTSPDPCWPGVMDLVNLALTGISGVRKTLESK